MYSLDSFFDALTNMIATSNQIQPLITWGKYSEGKIPISLTVNHMFVFGYHINSLMMQYPNILKIHIY